MAWVTSWVNGRDQFWPVLAMVVFLGVIGAVVLAALGQLLFPAFAPLTAPQRQARRYVRNQIRQAAETRTATRRPVPASQALTDGMLRSALVRAILSVSCPVCGAHEGYGCWALGLPVVKIDNSFPVVVHYLRMQKAVMSGAVKREDVEAQFPDGLPKGLLLHGDHAYGERITA